MEKKHKQEYESPEVMLYDISAVSVVMGSWGDGVIRDDDDDENNLYNY